MLHPYMENRDAGFELMSVATYCTSVTLFHKLIILYAVDIDQHSTLVLLPS